MKMRVSDYVAEYLEKNGVKQVFMLAGGGMMHLMDAVGRRKVMKYTCNHHEHACALSAEGYARKTGELGVCYATSGPGATNTLTGVVECWQDSVPVLFISGQSKLSQTIQGSKLFGLRQFGTFEVDIISMVKPVTKYAVFLNDPTQIRYHLEKAVSIALSGRPGPVFIDMPVDLQGAYIEPEMLKGYDKASEGETDLEPELSDQTVDEVIEKLKNAKRPLVLAGHGVRVSGQAELFLKLLERLQIPVATTQLGKDIIPYDHPLFVGHPGMKGDRAGNFAIQSADVILSLGSSLHVLTTGYELNQFAPKAYKIQVEIDPMVMKREQVGVQKKIQASIPAFLKKLDEKIEKKSGSPSKNLSFWQERCQLWKSELIVRKEPHAHPQGKMNYYDLNEALSDLAEVGSTIVADAGSAFYVIGQAFRVKEKQRVIISGALGAMGHALPVAIGASAADPASKVICLTGDGSFQTNAQELATLAHSKNNIALFVVSNGGYVSIRNTQRNFFDGFLVGTDEKSGVSMPDLEKLASAYGVPYLKADQLDSLRSVVSKALEMKGPVLCEVVTSREQEIIPTVSSMKREDGVMVSKPLHDMYPFMSPETLKKYMIQD